MARWKGDHRDNSGKSDKKPEDSKKSADSERQRRDEGPAASGDNVKQRNARAFWNKQEEKRQRGD
jgi:hypothetical protein